MSSPVTTIEPEATVRELADLLAAKGYSGVPVVSRGRLVGIVSEADLVRKAAGASASAAPRRSLLALLAQLWAGAGAASSPAPAATVRDLMTTDVVTAREDTPLRELARTMMTRGVNRVPVQRGEAIVGIVTRADVLKAFHRADEAIVDAVRAMLVEELWIDPAPLRIESSDGVVAISGELDRASDAELAARYAATLDGVVRVDTAGLSFRFDDRQRGA
jgi:CBS domain-containing protein